MSSQPYKSPTEFDQTIYIDLDCLLDTRVGVVAMNAPEAAPKLMVEDYWVRESDDFSALTDGVVTHELFREWWAKRDKDVLKISRPTNIIRILEELSEALVVSQVNLPFVASVQYLVNYWPYKLDEQEVAAFEQACEIITGNAVPVKMVNLPPEKVTPNWLKREVSLLIVYDYWTWMSHHKEEFLSTPIPEINLLAPAISHDKTLGVEDRTLEEFGEVNPFAIGEMVMASYLSVQLIPPMFFSLLRV